MLQFLACSFRLSGVKKLPVEAATYILEGLTKWSVEEFRNTFDMMLQQEHIKHLSSVLSMGVYALSTLVKIKSIVKLANTFYRYFCTSGSFNFHTKTFNPPFNCGASDHGVGICIHNIYQNNIMENKKNFVNMKQS